MNDQAINLAKEVPDGIGILMRPSSVRFSRTTRSVSLSRSKGISAPVAKSPLTAKTLVEQRAIGKRSEQQITQAA